MNISDNLNSSLQFTKKLFDDIGLLAILMVLSLIGSRLSDILDAVGLLPMLQTSGLTGLFLTVPVGIVGLVIGCVLSGYYARTIRVSPSSDAPPPLTKYWELFVDGVKIFFAVLAYMIVPVILFVLGGLSFLAALFLQLGTPSISPPNIVFGGIGAVLVLLGLVVLFFFLIILSTGIAHMIKTRKFGKVFAFKEIFNVIGRIGWSRYIGWLVLIGVIGIVVLAVTGSIPYGGWVISALITPVLGVFISRSLGTLYNDGAPQELRVAAPVVTRGMTCSSCGAPLQSHHKFCPNCGAAAPAILALSPPVPAGTKFCVNCGAKMPSTAKFCGHCGAKQA